MPGALPVFSYARGPPYLSLFSADRVLYKDDELLGPRMQSFSQRPTQFVNERANEFSEH